MRRWSKFKKRVENILHPNTKYYCEIYRMKSQRGSTDCPRLYIKVDKDIVWAYPPVGGDRDHIYPYDSTVSWLNDLIEEYLNTPRDKAKKFALTHNEHGLLEVIFKHDKGFHPYDSK